MLGEATKNPRGRRISSPRISRSDPEKQRFGLPCLSSTRVPTPAKKARTVLTQFIKTSPPVLTTVIREEKQIDQLYLGENQKRTFANVMA